MAARAAPRSVAPRAAGPGCRPPRTPFRAAAAPPASPRSRTPACAPRDPSRCRVPRTSGRPPPAWATARARAPPAEDARILAVITGRSAMPAIASSRTMTAMIRPSAASPWPRAAPPARTPPSGRLRARAADGVRAGPPVTASRSGGAATAGDAFQAPAAGGVFVVDARGLRRGRGQCWAPRQSIATCLRGPSPSSTAASQARLAAAPGFAVAWAASCVGAEARRRRAALRAHPTASPDVEQPLRRASAPPRAWARAPRSPRPQPPGWAAWARPA